MRSWGKLSKGSFVRINRGRLKIALAQVGKRAVRGVSDVFQSEGDKIRDLARDYAPREDRHLEHAITKSTEYSGINNRAVVTVYVDENAAADGDTSVGDYAKKMHDGDYKLGKLSRLKEAEVGVGKVGPKYLKRAVDERKGEVMERSRKKVKNAL